MSYILATLSFKHDTTLSENCVFAAFYYYAKNFIFNGLYKLMTRCLALEIKHLYESVFTTYVKGNVGWF